MGRMSQRKGKVIEREIVQLHRELGVFAERVPLSGASRLGEVSYRRRS
jgi:Holliday junction resolvase